MHNSWYALYRAVHSVAPSMRWTLTEGMPALMMEMPAHSAMVLGESCLGGRGMCHAWRLMIAGLQGLDAKRQGDIWRMLCDAVRAWPGCDVTVCMDVVPSAAALGHSCMQHGLVLGEAAPVVRMHINLCSLWQGTRHAPTFHAMVDAT